MKKISICTVLALLTLLISACTSEPPSSGETGKNKADSPISENTSMVDFLLADGAKAHYKGEGNEFAELDIEATHVGDSYVILRENNGGSYVQTIFKIETEKIMRVETAPIDIDQPLPTLDELNAMQPTEIYLQQPLTKGTTFGNWTIVEESAKIETPYQTFSNAIVIEMSEDDFVNRIYFVKGIGEVKRESIMTTDDGEFIVTSTLESIQK